MMARLLSGGWRSVALSVSLVVNILLVSAIAAYALRDRVFPSRDRAAFGIERLAAGLPAGDADRLRAAFATRAPDLSALQAEVRTSREAVRRALRAEPFQARALEDAMTTLAAKQAAMQRLFHSATAAAAATMTAEGRDRLAERPRRR